MTNSGSANSENITLPDVKEYHQCSQKMLQCAAMSDRSRRESVLALLPSNITTRINEGNTSAIHVFNIVQSCSQFFGGMDKLVIALYQVGGDTKEWFDLEQYLRPFARNGQVVPKEILESFQQSPPSPNEPQGNTNTGTGTQFNIGSQHAGRDINQGNTINAQGSQGFINNPTGPINQHFGAPPTVYNGPVYNTYNQPKGDLHMGDKISIQNSQNVNVKAKLEKVRQKMGDVTLNIGAIPNASQEKKDELKALVEQLKAKLQEAPEDNAEEVELVAERLEQAVKEVKRKNPDKEDVATSGNQLKKAAQNLAGVLPEVVSIAGQIATHLSGLF
jgi:hypothetical protein